MTKTDFDNKISNLNRNNTSNKTRHLIVEKELSKLEIFDSIYFVVKVILKMININAKLFSFSTNVQIFLEKLLALVVVITFTTGYVKGCWTKDLPLLLHLTIRLLHS